jgi:hypothetical protein
MHLSIYIVGYLLKPYYKNLAIYILQIFKIWQMWMSQCHRNSSLLVEITFSYWKKNAKNSPKNKSINLLSFYKPRKWMLWSFQCESQQSQQSQQCKGKKGSGAHTDNNSSKELEFWAPSQPTFTTVLFIVFLNLYWSDFMDCSRSGHSSSGSWNVQ